MDRGVRQHQRPRTGDLRPVDHARASAIVGRAAEAGGRGVTGDHPRPGHVHGARGGPEVGDHHHAFVAAGTFEHHQLVVAPRPRFAGGRVGDRWPGRTQGQQVPVQRQRGRVLALDLVAQVPRQHGGAEGRLVLRVGHLALPGEVGELLAPSAADRLDEVGVAVGRDVRERVRLGVLLAHEQHRHVRQGEQQRRGGLACLERGEVGQPVPGRAVADLVVVLQAGHEAVVGHVRGGRADGAAPVGGPAPRVQQAVAQHGGQVAQPRVVDVVGGVLAGQRGVQDVVGVVEPLGVEPVPADLGGADQPRVLQVGLGHDPDQPAAPAALGVHGVGELGQQVGRRLVHDPVHGVEPQPVDVEVADPPHGVLDDVAAHRVAVGPVDVEAVAPWGDVVVGEVGPEVAEDVSLGADVVVDDVEHDRDAVPVGGVDEAPQAVGAAVGVLHRVGEHAVVAPVAPARELRDRQQLDRGDPVPCELGQARDDRVEGALGREGADVQLVDDQAGPVRWGEAVVGPREGRRVVDGGRPVHALGLVAGRRVGPVDGPVGAVQPVAVAVARRRVLGHAGVVAVDRVQAQRRPVLEQQVDGLGAGRPHHHVHAAVHRRGAEGTGGDVGRGARIGDGDGGPAGSGGGTVDVEGPTWCRLAR